MLSSVMSMTNRTRNVNALRDENLLGNIRQVFNRILRVMYVLLGHVCLQLPNHLGYSNMLR